MKPFAKECTFGQCSALSSLNDMSALLLLACHLQLQLQLQLAWPTFQLVSRDSKLFNNFQQIN